MGKFMTSLIWVTLGPTVFSSVIELRDAIQIPAPPEIEAQCTNKCQGDFPDSSKRKYAQAPQAPRVTNTGALPARTVTRPADWIRLTA